MMININLKQETVLAICAGLSVLVLSSLGYSLWEWHRDWLLAHQEISTKQVAANTDESASIIAAIPNTHLFGQAFTKVGQVPITNLQLRVTGIVKMESDQSISKAYISISGQPSKIFQVGDSLPYGVKLYDIVPNAIILENKGHLEKLPLPREKLEFKSRKIQERA